MNATLLETDYTDILDKVQAIQPDSYARTRNFVDGAVTRLSPYISRGVISTRFVLEKTLAQGYDPKRIEKFIQELAWRDHWQHFQREFGDIDWDIRRPQEKVRSHGIPVSVLNASTGIEGVDNGLKELFETGYMHNHVRMYLASIVCNIGQCQWKLPSKWLYYHLLDGDHASNTLSWQWVAGSNSGKRYLCNQENINKYCHTSQKGTFLDNSYEFIAEMDVPRELEECTVPLLTTSLPEAEVRDLNPVKQVLIYNSYNLDPNWHRGEDYHRVLLLEPSHFDQHPVSENSLSFILDLSRNIPGIKIHVGEFDDLTNKNPKVGFRYKEHPLNQHYQGVEESRDWMFDVSGLHRSFFSYWKKCAKQLYA